MNSPIQIVDELSRSDDERVRRSTCVALSALDGDYGPRRLVELGLEDSSDAVRQGVAEELSILPGQNRTPLVSSFHEALDNTPCRAAAYDVLCRMSAAGVNVAELERSRFGRLIRFRSTKRLRWGRKTSAEFEALNSCLFGAAIGFFALLFLTNLLTAGSEQARDLDGTVFLFALAALVASYVMLIRSGPVGSHFDRSAEIVGEIIGAGLRASILSIIIVGGVVTVAYLEGNTVDFMEDIFEPFLVGCLLAFFIAVAARSGAILGAGVIAGGPLRRAFAVAVGGSLGLIVATLGAVVAEELKSNRTEDEFVAVTWLFGCIWSVALAYAFVGRDLFFDARFGRPTLGRLAGAGLPLLVVAASVIWLIPAFVHPAGPTDGYKLVRDQQISLPGGGGVETREIGEREIIDLNLKQKACVSIEATAKQNEFIVLLLGTGTGSILARPGDYPTARWKRSLTAGTYELSAVPGVFLDSIGSSIEATLSSPRSPYRGRVDVNDIFPLLIDSLLRRARDGRFPMRWGGAMVHVEELADAQCTGP